MGSEAGSVPRQSEERLRSSLLVVEDEVLLRMMVADQLRQAGFEVIECAAAAEAIAVLRSGAAIDAILCDINMPGEIDGITFARLARSEYPDIKICLASGNLPDIQSVAHDGYFAKPYDVECVIRHIRTLIE